MLSNKAHAVAIGLAAVLASGSASGMTGTSADRASCRVVSGAKLPAGIGGADALCRAIEAAAKQRAPGARFSVEVRVPSASALSAVVRMGDGRRLAEQNMAVSDARLDKAAIGRFAVAIADQIARERSR